MVNPTTLNKYRARIKSLRKTMNRKFGDSGITADRFRLWLSAAVKAKVGGSTPEGYRSAVLFFQKLNDTPQWASDQDIRDVCNIHQTAMKSHATPTGTLTRDMFEQLLEYVRKRDKHIALCMKFHALIGGRISQVLSIRAGDVKIDGSQAVVYLRRDKRRRRINTKRASEHHRKLVHRKVYDLERAIATQDKIKHGDRLFGDISHSSGPRQINRLIQEGARALNFPKGYRYAGSHTLRHCGTALLLEQASELTKSMMTQMSAPIQRHYGNPNSMRRR